MTTTHWYQRGARRERAPAVTDDPFPQVLLLGIATVLFGVAVLVWPAETLRLLGIITGVWLIVLGLMRVATALRPENSSGRRALAAVMAVILLVAGITCVRNADNGVIVLATMLGVGWLLSGFALLLIATPAREAARVWLSVIGFVSVLIGLAFMLWPGLTLGALVLVSGIGALVIGAGEITFALRLRRARSDVTPQPQA